MSDLRRIGLGGPGGTHGGSRFRGLCISATAVLVLVALPVRQAAVRALGETTVAASTSTGTLHRVGVVNLASLPAAPTLRATSSATRQLPARYAHGTAAQHAARAAAALHSTLVPHVGSTVGAPSATVLHNFNGLNSLDSYRVNAFHVEPPDQGLCVGPGAPVFGSTVEIEMVNVAVTLRDPSGIIKLGPVSLNNFFFEGNGGFGHDAVFISDPRCYYDPTAQAWFATTSVIDTVTNTSRIDVAVDPNPDPRGPWSVYSFDTTSTRDANCPCFGDFPLLGVDNHGVYVSTNEFPIDPNNPGFNGSQIYAISKSQLLAGAATVHLVHYGNINLPGGFPSNSIEPALNPHGSAVEYFLSALDPNGTVDNRIAVWAMTGDAALDTKGTPKLSSVVITSELYGQPPPATQKGSPNPLSPDDDAMMQVMYVNGILWSSLDTAVLVPGDIQSRNGAAWFAVLPSLSGNKVGGALIRAQGYVAVKGNDLLYPAVAVNDANAAAMSMTATGPGLFPSAAYATGPGFSSLHVAAFGATSDHGFTCFPADGGPPCRWGDYSAAVRDNLTGNLWLATEYIPGPGDALTNWGTRIWEVSP